jgi:hypothetical protein
MSRYDYHAGEVVPYSTVRPDRFAREEDERPDPETGIRPIDDPPRRIAAPRGIFANRGRAR